MKERVLKGAIAAFQKKGMKFTMDDLASELGMSKKTIYTVFEDKNALLNNMVDYVFDIIKQEEDLIYNNPKLSTVEKIRGILGVMPESYAEFDFKSLYLFRDKYPQSYARARFRLESGWEKTRELLAKGIADGDLKKNLDLDVFQMIYEATIERMIMEDDLVRADKGYMDALNKVVGILVDGILEG